MSMLVTKVKEEKTLIAKEEEGYIPTIVGEDLIPTFEEDND